MTPARRTACTGSTLRRRSCRSSRGSSRSTGGPWRTDGAAGTGTKKRSERRQNRSRDFAVVVVVGGGWTSGKGPFLRCGRDGKPHIF